MRSRAVAANVRMHRPGRLDAREATGSLLLVAILLALAAIWIWQGGV